MMRLCMIHRLNQLSLKYSLWLKRWVYKGPNWIKHHASGEAPCALAFEELCPNSLPHQVFCNMPDVLAGVFMFVWVWPNLLQV